MTATRIGILGTGYMALKVYLPGFRRQGASVEALWGRSERRVQELARHHQIPRFYTDQEALISDPEVDVVVIATPNVYHHSALIATAAAGKAVLCEKPLGMNLAQAEEMAAAASAAGIFNAVPFIWRLPFQAQLIRQKVEQGFLDRVLDYQAVFAVGAWASEQSSMGWRGDAELAGAGVLVDFGGHLGDLAHFYVGELAEVVGQGTIHIPERTSPGQRKETVTAMDDCNVLIRFKNGAQGSLHMSYVDMAHNLLLRLEMHGSQGAILFELQMEADQLHTRLGLRALESDQLIWECNTEPFAAVVDRFCASFLSGMYSGVTELPTLREGVRAQAIIEAVDRSIHSGKWESV